MTTSGAAPRATLAIVLLGFLTLPMLMSGTTVALPGIGADLGATGAGLQWVVTGYFLAASSCMLVAGSLGDLFGRRRVFRIGAVLYTGATAVGAFAGDLAVLNTARMGAGVGAAGVMAAGGAMLASTFTGPARTRAFAMMGTVAGVGIALGPSLSGWLISALGWRLTFACFAGIGLVMIAGTFFAAESKSGVRPRVDWAGALTFIAGLGLVMFAITRGGALVPLVAGLALLAAFVVVERRSDHPVLDFALLGDRRFLGWSVGALAVVAGFAGALIFLPTYLQGVTGWSARDTGLTMLLLTAPVLVGPSVSGWLVNHGVPGRLLLTASLGLLAAGNALLTVLHPGIGPAGLALPLLVLGFGSGLAIGLVDAQAMNFVEPARTGMAAGFLNTIRGGSNTLAMAVFGALLLALVRARLGDAAFADRVVAGTAGDPAGAFTAAWRTLLWGAAALCAFATIVVNLLLGFGRAAGRNGATRSAVGSVPAASTPAPFRE
ncbi:MFS transporter [Amycolatopsis magusensis]|uniref:MFS family permease n=1 Tax=Amycolatopsis magusensis TaxID=882444 RepID=A0ABS4Q5I9_9PSEU|nr:MFS transporter [Amycolatopsis magusensis]MBP2186945.1 MFS family permease [Amycolatopsis magusensis]MDI5975117.1 MFS transporter [Amycolatopsis magusensis]